MSVTETVPFFPIYKVGVFPITRRTVSLSSSIRYTCGIVSAASVVSFAANAVAGTAPISIHAARNVAIQRNPFIFILFLSSWLFYFSYLCQLSIFLRLFQNFVDCYSDFPSIRCSSASTTVSICSSAAGFLDFPSACASAAACMDSSSCTRSTSW